MTSTQKRLALALILLHGAITLAHGVAHRAEEIFLPPVSNIFVIVVIVLGPFVALGLLFTRHPQAGAWVLTLSMLGALLFGVVHHFVLPGADNVAEVGPETWGITFQATAFLLAALEAGGVLVGAWMLHTLRRWK